MPYYPKSQIKTNQYTNGGEYLLSTTLEPYKGYFYEVSNGDKFVGKSPSYTPYIALIEPTDPITNPPIKHPSPSQRPITSNYRPLYQPSSPVISRFLPTPNPTTPTEKDYKYGEFQRYFAKKNNELRYLEIDKQTYNYLRNRDSKIAWDLYSPLTVTWELTGDEEQVYKVNKNMVELAEKRNKWYGFTQWFRDKFSKYYLAS